MQSIDEFAIYEQFSPAVVDNYVKESINIIIAKKVSLKRSQPFSLRLLGKRILPDFKLIFKLRF